MQENMQYTIKDILSMSPMEFETFIATLDEQKIKEEVPEMTIDQAFPQFFTDPNRRRESK